MNTPAYHVTPGLLSKLSGVPRATIVNWLEARVARPRRVDDVLKVAEALRLSESETDLLLRAAGQSAAIGVRIIAPNAREAEPPTGRSAGLLPSMPTELIGREHESNEIALACRRPGSRLVTLIGTGGVGKTHLAISVATSLAATFEDALAWVSYAGYDDPSDLLPAIASAVGAKETGAISPLRTIVNALAGKRALLLLDNLEQLATGAQSLAELLESLPQLVLLATSRVSLNIRGERIFRVQPLALTPTSPVSPGAVTQSPAATLFCARAAAAGCELFDAADLATVAAICERLDGLPLAIELAASWTRVLTPAELLDRLEHRLTILTNGKRDGAVRHRSLRDTIAWSYGLLSEPQRVVFRRLAVFSSGFGVDAAEAVCCFDDPEADTLDLLRALVDQNLLNVTFAPGAPHTRFTMLETIREFAIEMLHEHREYDRLRRTHAHYFLALAETVDASFASQPTAVWMSRLRGEHENLRAALTWAFEDGVHREIGVRLVAALARYWFERGLFREARRWLERCPTHGEFPMDALSARVALYVAFVANYEGDYSAGMAAATEALDAFARIGDAAGCTQARTALGIAALYTGDVDLAEVHFTQTLTEQRRAGDRRGIAVSLHNLGEVAAECRLDVELAERLYEESLALFRSIGHTLNVASTLGVLGELHAYRGDLTRAIELASQSIEAYTGLDNRPLVAEGYTRLARYKMASGDDGDTPALLARAIEEMRRSFNPRHVADCFEAHAIAADRSSEPEVATVFLGYAEHVRDHYHVPLLLASEQRHTAFVDTVRARVCDTDFEENWSRGYTLPAEEAFEFAKDFVRRL